MSGAADRVRHFAGDGRKCKVVVNARYLMNVASTKLKVGDLVLFPPDLVLLTNYNIDFARAECFSE